MREAKMEPGSPISQRKNDRDALAAERIRTGMLLGGEVKQQYTVDDVRNKLEAELEVFKDGDSRYVIKKLIERSETDCKLLQGIMRPDKSYDKAFQYFFQRSRSIGYKLPYGNLVFLDNDSAVRLAVEYFKGEKKTIQPKKKRTIKVAEVKTPVETKAERTPVPLIDKVLGDKKSSEGKKKENGVDGQISLFDFT